MSSRAPGRTWLRVLAAFNLVFWVVIAIVAGLLATDAVDLGVESMARQYQATGVAAWQRVTTGGPGLGSIPTRVAAAYVPTGGISATPAPDDAEIPSDEDGASGGPAPQPTATGQPAGGQQASGGGSGTGAPTPEPVRTLVSRVLVIADPGLAEAAELATEMNQSAVGRPIQIVFSEDALNREVEVLLSAREELPFDNVRLDLGRDYVIATGSSTVLGLSVGTEVQGSVVAENCLPLLHIDKVSVAGVLAPSFFARLIKEELVGAMDWYPAQSPLCLEQILLEESRVTIYAHRR